MDGLDSPRNGASGLGRHEKPRMRIPDTPEGKKTLADEIGSEGVALASVLEVLNGENSPSEAMDSLESAFKTLRDDE